MTLSDQSNHKVIQTTPLSSFELSVGSSSKVRKLPQNKNIKLINDFYEKFYSLRNLGLKASLLVVAFIITIVKTELYRTGSFVVGLSNHNDRYP